MTNTRVEGMVLQFKDAKFKLKAVEEEVKQFLKREEFNLLHRRVNEVQEDFQAELEQVRDFFRISKDKQAELQKKFEAACARVQ
jgi:methionyl-tRNA synthetase